MSINLTEKNNDNIIENVFNFADTHLYFTIFVIMTIAIIIIILSKGVIKIKLKNVFNNFIKIGGEHQEAKKGSAYIKSTHIEIKK